MAKSMSEMLAKVVTTSISPTKGEIDVETTVDDLDRIKALPRRPPFNCVKDPTTKLYEPRTQALVEIMTARFSRGKRLSCACRPRHVRRERDGSLVVFRILPEGLPPDPPLVTTVEAFIADCSTVIATEIEVARQVAGLRPGEEVQLPAADGEIGHACIMELNAVQSWILYEAPICGGVVGYIVVGGGKSICGILAPLAFPDCKLAVLLGEPGQRRHYRSQYLRIREHFRTPSFVLDDGPGWTVPGTPPLHFVPYSKLSSQASTDLLERFDPDLVVEDEAHRTIGANSARGRRVKRYFEAKIKERERAIAEGRPVRARAVRLLAWSGTLEARSIRDTQSVCAFALGDGSPLPIDKHEAERWSPVMDPIRQPDQTSSTAKRLQKAFVGREYDAASTAARLSTGAESMVRKGFCEWRRNTLGIVTTTASAITAAITFHKYDVPPMPEAVKAALQMVREGQRPDGDLLAEKARQVMCAMDVASGYFPYWRFDKNESDDRIAAWFLARKNFYREMRGQLQRGEVHLDSENLCVRAAERFWRGRDLDGNPIALGSMACAACDNEGSMTCATCSGKGRDVFEYSCTTCRGDGRVPCKECGGACTGLYQGRLPIWPAQNWPAWRDIKDKVKHDERVRWIGQKTSTQEAVLDENGHVVGEFLARSVAAWAKENRGVVWCSTRPLGTKIAEIAGLPYHDGGTGGEERLRAEKGNRSVIVSVRAFGFGFDSLQEKFWEQVITKFPSSNLVAEQLMGRLLRPGQTKDEVVTRACLHTSEMMDALRKSVTHAEFNSEMLSSSQALLAADYSFDF